MILALVAALAGSALPTGAVRFRAELGDVPVGVAELRISCAEATCSVASASRLRAPVEAGGGLESVEVEVEVDRDGRFRGGRLGVARGGASGRRGGVPGAVPAALVEVVLAGETAHRESCLEFFDEERPAPRTACARRDGSGALAADVVGVRVRIVPGPDGFPLEVEVAGRFRYLRDSAAEVPARPPRLAGTRVLGPDDPRRARAFCGVAPDPAPPPPGRARLPAPAAAGESCREKTAAWLEVARAGGLEARAVVGVAWDGSGFVWHEWAEARAGGAWIPVDPSFGELPARAPRFSLARFGAGDPAGRDAAGARILACWGSALVTR